MPPSCEVYYDFETLISKGGKRKYTKPIEVAFFIKGSERWFHTKIWPFAEQFCNGKALTDLLGVTKQRVKASISCIEKVGGLCGAPCVKVVNAMILDFLPDDVLLIAHNGKSFDDHILQHWFPEVAARATFKDSIDILKAVSPDLPTYSLPVLTRPHRQAIRRFMSKKEMPSDLFQHRALFDVIAMHHVLLAHTAFDDIVTELSKITLTRKWEDIKGIGPIMGSRLRQLWSTPDAFINASIDTPHAEIQRALRGIRVRHQPILHLLHRPG
tara:strand:+ start:10745 stop:11554 length:810 start_codon:yes stop_codon:yes gene_type:complete